MVDMSTQRAKAAHSQVNRAERFRTMQFRYLCVYMFMIYTPAAAIQSFFPLYYRDSGYTDAMYGLQNALLPIVGMIGSFLFGLISDKRSRIKSILMTIMLLLMVVIYFIFHVSSLWLMMGLVLLFQFLWAPVSSLTDSMVMLSARRLNQTFATIRGFGAAGFAVAAGIIGWILDLLPGESTMGWIVIGLIGCTWLTLCLIRDPRSPQYVHSEQEKKSEKEQEIGQGTAKEEVRILDLAPYIMTPRFMFFIAAMIVYQMTFSFNDQYFGFLIRELNGTSVHIGLGWMLPAAVEVAIFLYLGRSRHRLRPLPMLAISAVIFSIRSFILAWTDSLVVVMLLQAVQGIAIAFFFIYVAEYMMETIPDKFRASGQAVLQMIMSIGAAVTGSVIGAYLYHHYGLEGLFVTGGWLLMISIGIFLWAERLERAYVAK
ncbi:MFS transporter [Paenibacillus sp. SC116]|uniref:MFS transporter n=1 Tax=Paenibacillus sp. SC116 TaxID=2968986 RepID=UPI00215AE44C|nr:MFS transporter [Paenibacillus sp. SC116]MCR8844025.1 MFS transporter [Paenibacillus sp. SC116]